MRFGKGARRELKEAIRLSLRPPDPGMVTGRHFANRAEFLDKLEGCAAVAFAEDGDARALLRWHYCDGMSAREIGRLLGLAPRTVEDRIGRLLDRIVDVMPYELAREILRVHRKRPRQARKTTFGSHNTHD